jgi:hypothetical protein
MAGLYQAQPEAPSSNIQASTPKAFARPKLQQPSAKRLPPVMSHWSLGFLWDLVLGIWDFFKISCDFRSTGYFPASQKIFPPVPRSRG